MMKYAVVTGVSAGLGLDTTKLLLQSGMHVLGISRTDNQVLYDIAKENDVQYTHYACDLGTPEEVTKTVEEISDKLVDLGENDSLYMINNAAVIQPIKRADTITQEELAHHYQVNVFAPMQWMNTILAKSKAHKFTVIGVNITSGAAVGPLFGWSAYCSSKASMNMYTKTTALEQNELQTGNKIIAFNPGVMDTNMQAEIRSADKEDFLLVGQFKQYKQQGILSLTESVASVLVDIITDEGNIMNGAIYDVNDYK